MLRNANAADLLVTMKRLQCFDEPVHSDSVRAGGLLTAQYDVATSKYENQKRTVMSGTKVYLAGPDVFYPDALARGHQMRVICAAYGFVGVYPLDTPIDATLPDASKAIFKANRELIDGADAVLANLRDFRGFEPDSGTVWEVAYALAKGKTVIGYLPTAASILQRMGNIPQDGVDEAGCTVENFGLPLNLMLAHSLSAIAYGEESNHEGLKAALAKLQEFCVVGV